MRICSRALIIFIFAHSLSCGFAAELLSPTVVPIPRTDEASQIAHEQFLEKAKRGGIEIYFVGDSIIQRWGATNRFSNEQIGQSWITNFSGWRTANFGWGGDTIENILWRLVNGELDGVHPKIIVILAGINNIGTERGPDEKVSSIAAGMKAIVDVCREKAPAATIILTAIFPRNDSTAVIPVVQAVNRRIAKLADQSTTRFLDINAKISGQTGQLLPGMVGRDKLHPSATVYQIWADALKPIFREILGPPARTNAAGTGSGP